MNLSVLRMMSGLERGFRFERYYHWGGGHCRSRFGGNEGCCSLYGLRRQSGAKDQDAVCT
jgi:hypothetical protein